MIFGIGCDITEIARIDHALKDFGQHFLDKILTKYEQENKHGAVSQYVAGRFAAKEATVKALGTGFRNGITMTDIEIRNNENGAPVLYLYNKALAYAQANNITKKCISISHERSFAVAYVILEYT